MRSKLIVKSHEPTRIRIAVAALVLLVIAGSWGLFEWGLKAAGYNRVEAARVRGELNDQISVLEKDNASFRRDLALLRTSDRIDREAYSQVSAELDDLQSQIAELNEELAFYRGIMSPSDGRSGLQIKTVQISPGADPGRFDMRLILVQAGRHDVRVQGSVEFSVIGESTTIENDDSKGPVTINLSQLTGETDKLRYSFRYFQILERNLGLPQGFVPKTIDISLSGGRKGNEVSASFPWQLMEN